MVIQIFALLFTLNASASVCPNLSGSYHCISQSNQYLLFTVKQKTISTSGEPEKVTYAFDYPSIPGEPDVVTASTIGEPDSIGWLTKCSKNRLIAIPLDGSMMAEIYLDANRNYVRTMNGSVIQNCPRKK